MCFQWAFRWGGEGGEKGKTISPENCYSSQNILTRNQGYSLEFDRNLRESSGWITDIDVIETNFKIV